ncbi:hypothetical protein [Sinorhizobium psoraleae]|uniref:Transposase n=1 Tax=Sinorhizobium psoraleae TaxID=520838 RepID=A0ABT4K9S7_9HYPH|nr:hypothetical protein [Sinorhizobium psoraleae]MCZ4088703.1 hypothetical protein [Sinorhizobium psoraleae]
MPDVSTLNEIAELIAGAQEKKHRQRYLGAITAFTAAEKLILDQVPHELREGAQTHPGPNLKYLRS